MIDLHALIFIGIVFICLYVFTSIFLTSRKCDYLHETSLALIVGAIFGFSLYITTDFFSQSINSLARTLIFLILLPPVLFEDGYNVPHRKFFQNFLYINLYGFIGTVIQFIFMFGIIYLFNISNLISAFYSNKFNTIVMTNWQIFLLCASLSSIQPLVAQKIVNSERYPKLFSIVFGQSILKDTFAVVLFEAICKVVEKNPNIEFTPNLEGHQVGLVIGIFFQVVVCSVLIGVIGSIITTLLFKHCRFLSRSNGVGEVTLIVGTGFAVYIASQWANFSGVISMLFAGIFLSHFNNLNISNRGKQVTITTVGTIKIVAEGLLYLLVGIFIFNVQYNAIGGDDNDADDLDNALSYVLILITIMVLIVGRIINIYLMSLLGWIIVGKESWRLNRFDYEVIFISGIVKGPVPFALILGTPGTQSTNSSIAIASNSIVITVVYIVFFSSVFINSATPFLLRNRLRALIDNMKKNPFHPSIKDSFIVSPTNLPKELGKFRSFTQKWVNKMQEGFLKPFLIYNYYGRRQQLKMQKLRQRQIEYKQYMEALGLHSEEENFLDPDGPNKFIDLQPSSDQEQNSNLNAEIDSDRESNYQQTKHIKKQKHKKTPSEIEVPLFNNVQKQ